MVSDDDWQEPFTTDVDPQSPEACMARLLALETVEDAAKILALLEDGWQDDWAGAFGKAARIVFGGRRFGDHP